MKIKIAGTAEEIAALSIETSIATSKVVVDPAPADIATILPQLTPTVVEDWSKGIDWAKWAPRMANKDIFFHKDNLEAQYYCRPGEGVGYDPFVLGTDGSKNVLKIRARKTLASELGLVEGQTVLSGVLANWKTMEQVYGYFEVECAMDSGKPGMWPAIWMLKYNRYQQSPEDTEWPPEIDIMEWVPSLGANQVHVNQFWWQKDKGGITSAGGPVSVSDVEGWHRYGVLWTENNISWYIDRKLVASRPNPKDVDGVSKGLHEPMYLILDLAAGKAGSWPGAVTLSKLPAEVWFGEVRAWKWD
jgi:beta-glucanase (GH16 family)